MHRICGSLFNAGYDVWLVGRKMRGSVPVIKRNFRQKRLHCFFSRSFLFYAEYNLRLFCFLLFAPKAILCAIDLDTILPVYFTSVLRKTKRVYDAHELFTEQKEVVSRKRIHAFWLAVERFAVPRFPKGYTVNAMLAGIFRERYGVVYAVIPNYPLLTDAAAPDRQHREPCFIYQGAVNEGRCFETLIPAMKQVPAGLLICGTGNFLAQAMELVKLHGLEEKIRFGGNRLPGDLPELTAQAYAGITLFEAAGLNQYYSLSNRFFDYIMAGIPQLCVNYPLYKAINDQYDIMYPINNTDSESIANGLNKLLNDHALYKRLREHCQLAREGLNWLKVAPKLISFYQQL
ncbi:glycosyltransferase family 4 protein [Sediminibacterium sp. WSJ-3]|nr:glycosyltransferase family 4 protein [Sediminibacterium soli]